MPRKIDLVEVPDIPKPAAVKNAARVPLKQWRRWGSKARNAFNYLYFLMMKDPGMFKYPGAIKENPRHWKTTAWNVAWLAADAVEDAVRGPKIKRGTPVARAA